MVSNPACLAVLENIQFVSPSCYSHIYSEMLVHLPHCYFVNDYKQVKYIFLFKYYQKHSLQCEINVTCIRWLQKNLDVLDPSCQPKRSDYGLPEDKFLFACFNQLYKIDPEVFMTWCGFLLRRKCLSSLKVIWIWFVPFFICICIGATYWRESQIVHYGFCASPRLVKTGYEHVNIWCCECFLFWFFFYVLVCIPCFAFLMSFAPCRRSVTRCKAWADHFYRCGNQERAHSSKFFSWSLLDWFWLSKNK